MKKVQVPPNLILYTNRASHRQVDLESKSPHAHHTHLLVTGEQTQNKKHWQEHICTFEKEKQNNSYSLFLKQPELFQFIIYGGLVGKKTNKVCRAK